MNADLARELLDYNPETGALTWRKRRPFCGQDAAKVAAWNSRLAGKSAGSVFKRGYIVLSVLGKKYQAHRVIFLHVTGNWPDEDLDHIDGDRTNNKWSNLRPATRSQNLRNTTRLRRNNTSGVKGVSYDKRTAKWRARLWVTDKSREKGRFYKAVGSFKTLEGAEAAIKKAREKYHGGYAKHVTSK